MNQKQRGSEKLQFQCGKTGVRSIEDFQHVEELLEASGGVGGVVPLWWIRGTPAFWNVNNPAVNPLVSQTFGR